MAGLTGVVGYHNVSKEKARELIIPHSNKNGFYLLRPSGDQKGAVLCTICVTHDSKVLNYRVSTDRGKGTFYVNQTVQFRSMQDLLSYYTQHALNEATGTRLVSPVGGQPPAVNGSEDCYVVMEKPAETQAAPAPQPKPGGGKFRNRPLPSAPGPAPLQPTPAPTPAPVKPRPSSQSHTPKHRSPAHQSQEIPGLHPNLLKSLLKTAMLPYLGQDGWFLLRPSSTDNQLTLTLSHEGRILNFKMSESGGQFFIAAKNKFPSIQKLISHYHNNPIRSKQRVDKTILLVNPIPVDPQLEATARLMADELQKAQTAASCLPPPWQEHYNDQYKRNFYYNPETGARQWERPTAPPKPHPQPHPQPQVSEQTKRSQKRPLPSLPGQEGAGPEPTGHALSMLMKRQTMPAGNVRPPVLKKRDTPLPSVPEKRDTPLPSLPEKRDTPLPSLPEKIPLENGIANGVPPSLPGRGGVARRPPASLPGQEELSHPLPSTNSGAPPSLPPSNRSRRHASVTAATRGNPPLPIPVEEPAHQPPPPVLRSSSQRQLPPLPQKEEPRPAPPPLPIKEDPSPIPSPQHVPQSAGVGTRKPRRNIIEYEDVPTFKPKKKTAPPPLPEKEEEPPQAPPTRERGPPPPLPEKEAPTEAPSAGDRAPPPLPEKIPSPPITPSHYPPVAPAPPPVAPPTAGSPPPPPPPGIPPPPSPMMNPRARETRSQSEASIATDMAGRPFNACDLLAGAQRLKKVEMSPDMRRNTVPEAGGLEGTLNRAITNKFRNVQLSDSEEEEFDEVDDDEWN